MTPETPDKLEIDWLKTAAGAFAAVSSAFLLSTLGAAGTIIGAALGSVIVTVGGALYSQGLARSHRRLAQVQTAARRKAGSARSESRTTRRPGDVEAGGTHVAPAAEPLGDGQEDPGSTGDEMTDPSWRQRLVILPWKRISMVAAGLFAAAILSITVIELVAGESVASMTGGTDGGGDTTIGRIGGGSGGDTPQDEGNEAPPDDESSDQPAPTDAPTGEPTPAPESPTPTPTATPTDPPTPEPTVTTDPGATPSTD